MTVENILEQLKDIYPEATMVRVGKQNYLAIPTEETENGRTVYRRVTVGSFATKDTARTAAFDFEQAVSAYEDWVIASNLKKAEKKTTSQRTQERLNILSDYIDQHSFSDLTATEIFDEVVPLGFTGIVATCGAVLRQLVRDGKLTAETKGKKTYYTTVDE